MTNVLHTKEQGRRLHNLANLGGLVAIAGLEDIDPATLLGALLEVAERLPQLALPRLEMLRENGIERLHERNSEKRAYQSQPKSRQLAADTPTNLMLTTADVKALLIKINGKTPLLEKDWIPELIRLIRG